jgi:hypothetical protein
MTTIISPSAMPPQQLPSYPPGANSPMTAGIIKQQQQAEMQNIRNKIGGAPVIQVPPVPSGSISPSATASNYKQITELAQTQATQSVYDTAKTQNDTSSIAAQQKAFYKGGKRSRRRYKSRRRKSRKSRRHRRR